MERKNMFSILVPVALLALCGNSFAGEPEQNRWHSFGLFGSTHGKIAKKTLKRIDKNLYPDIRIAEDVLIAASASERGHADFRRDNGGNVKEIWETGNRKNQGGVLPNYAGFRFREAYYSLGVICHLTQDQAVPAHAANIEHFLSEGFEEYADYNGQFGDIPLIESSKRPYEYYQLIQDETRSKLASWVNPATGKPFWEPSATAPRFGEDATFGTRGSYGGGKDTYAVWRDVPGVNGEQTNAREMVSAAPEITTDRLSAAAGYTQAVLESASRALPPLVKGLKLSANITTPGKPVEITFTALENRTENLKFSITLTPKDGAPETISAGELKLDASRPSFSGPGDGDGPAAQPELECLFGRNFSFNWDGLYMGRPAPEGSYLIEVNLTDEDGNTVPAEANSDATRDNDSKILFTVVNTVPPPPAPFSFDGD